MPMKTSSKVTTTDMELTPVEPFPWARWMFFGENRTGKSYTAYTALEDGPTIVLDFGKSTNTAIHSQRFRQLVDNNWAYSITHPDQAMLALDAIGPPTVEYPHRKNWIEEIGLKWIVLDELDNLHKHLMRVYMPESVKQAQNNNRKKDRFKPEQADWGYVRMQMDFIIQQFFSMPVNIIVTSWAKRAESEITGREEIMPSLPGKLVTDIAGECDIFYFDMTRKGKEEVYSVRIKGTSVIQAGVRGPDRADRLGDLLVSPTIPEMYNLWLGDQ